MKLNKKAFEASVLDESPAPLYLLAYYATLAAVIGLLITLC